MSPTTAAPTRWPLREHYQRAVLNPSQSLKDPRLHACEVEKRMFLGALNPYLRSGNFGAVYRLSNGRSTYALKVFSEARPDREIRYQLIDQHLSAAARLPSLVSFGYNSSGILVNGHWYPALVMDWVDGMPLDRHLTEMLTKRGEIDNGHYCREWAEVVLGLRRIGVAHGDLQHGNILVMPDRSLKLVDYDGMFVPAMLPRGLAAAERGLSAYQHPGRRQQFDERLDNFSALVVLLGLACANGDLWQRYHTNDNCLLLQEQDLRDPDRSPILAELAQSPVDAWRKLAVILRAAARGPMEAVPELSQVVADGAVQPILAPGWRPSAAMRRAGSPAPGQRAAALMAPRPYVPPQPVVLREELTALEKSILRLMVLAMEDEAIGQQLSIPAEAVKQAVTSIERKLGLSGRAALVRWAYENGWMEEMCAKIGPLMRGWLLALKGAIYLNFCVLLPYLIVSSFFGNVKGWPIFFMVLIGIAALGHGTRSIVAGRMKEKRAE